MKRIMKKKIGIYCDLTPSTGLGHLIRMKFLAFELEKFQVKTFFFFNYKYKKFVKKYTKNLNLIFFSNKKLSEFQSIKLSVIKNKISTMIFDSYKEIYHLEKIISNEKILTVSIDDHSKKHATNIVCTNRIDKVNKDFPEQIWLKGPKYILIKKIKKKTNIKKNSKFKILLHAGGSSAYKSIKNFCENIFRATKEFNLSIDVLCSTLESKKYIQDLLKKNKIKDKLNYLNYSEKFTSSFYKYDLIAGPSGTTTYESILAGVLPFSTILNNDGRDSLVSWINLGHLMHLDKNEKNDKKILHQSLKLILEKKEILLRQLKKNSKQLDGFGPKRLAGEIINYRKKKLKNSLINKEEVPIQKFIYQSCTIKDIREFLYIRNQKQNRMVSSDPNHIISWPEHVMWWTNDKIKKYNVIRNNSNVGYFWIKMLTDRKGSFVVTGWFLNNNQKDKLMIANEICKFQYHEVKKFYKNLTWVITIKKDNDFLNRLNLKFGFKDPVELSKERALRVFSTSTSKFNIMEMKI